MTEWQPIIDWWLLERQMASRKDWNQGMKGLHPDITPLEKGILTKLRAIKRENTLRVFREGRGWKAPPWWPIGNETAIQSNLRGTIVTTTENIWKCGKVCKILRGLKIHQAKIKCVTEKRQENRTAVSDQTVEDQHYRTENLQTNVSSQEDKSEANEVQRVYQETLLADDKKIK